MKISILLILICSLIACERDKSDNYDLIITNVNLIDGTGRPLQPHTYIGVRDGKIVKVDSVLTGRAINEIDGTGKYLIPGLFDCHVHTSNFERDFPRFIHYGVTSIFITGGSSCTNEYYAAMRAQGNQDTIPAPIIFHTSQHFTMEGRHPVKTYFGNWIDGKTVFFLKDTIQIERLVKEVTQYPIVGIKLTIEDGPQPPWVERIPQDFINKVQKEAVINGTEVFAHVSDNIELEMALNAGIQNLVHWTGIDLDFERDTIILDKLHRIKPSFITTLMIDKGFLYPLFPEWVEAVRQENVFDEEDLSKADEPGYKARSEENIRFWRDFFQSDQIELKDIAVFQVEDIRALQEVGIIFALGTDTGPFIFPGYSLHEEMQLFELGGMDQIDIIKMGTLNAAMIMNAHDSLGSIETGKIANMVLLDLNPLEAISNTLTINEVIKRGTIQKRIQNQ